MNLTCYNQILTPIFEIKIKFLLILIFFIYICTWKAVIND